MDPDLGQIPQAAQYLLICFLSNLVFQEGAVTQGHGPPLAGTCLNNSVIPWLSLVTGLAFVWRLCLENRKED